MTQKYYAIVTNLGAAKIANAAALGSKLNITQMAVGDGGGTLPTPNASQTKMIKEVRRAAINTLSIDPANASQIIAEQVIPETEGGFWIREMGLFDADGTLIAVCNTPETYKPALQEGSGRTQTVRMILIVNSTDAITLRIDPSVVLATRKYVDDAVIEVKAYADNLMKKHVTAADPHTQYAPKKSPAFTGGAKVDGAFDVNGGGSYVATLTLGYRLNLQRAGGLPYQSFSRSDVPSAPASDTEMGRVLFGYGMGATDVWGTGGIIGYLNALAMPTGGGKVNLFALNAASKVGAGITLDADAGTVLIQGAASLPDGSAAVTQAKGDNSARIATTAFVQAVCPPVGIPVPWPSETPPAGWLKCNGASFSATAYPELANAYPSLKLPDLRGEFIRGWDDGRGVDSGRALLSLQGHALQQHTHTVTMPLRTADSDRGSLDSTYSVDNTQTVTTSGASGSTATETRPRNVAFNYIVRAA